MSTPDRELFAAADLVTGRLLDCGITVDGTRRLQNGLQLLISREHAGAKINLYHSSRKGLSVVASGGDESLAREAVRLASAAAAPGSSLPLPAVGQDEAGKGDYFGPLVAAGFCMTPENAAGVSALGLTDSKNLSDARVMEISSALKESFEDFLAVVSIMPEEYNRRFAALRNVKRNSLDMLSAAHWQVLSDLLSRGHSPRVVVIDKFCSYARFLDSRPSSMSANVELRERAEEEPCVAAASILARGAYLRSLHALGREAGVELSPGSGSRTDQVGRVLLESVGRERLGRFAKLHFRNTAKLLGHFSP